MPTTVCPSFASCRKTEREFLVGGPLDNIARELSLCGCEDGGGFATVAEEAVFVEDFFFFFGGDAADSDADAADVEEDAAAESGFDFFFFFFPPEGGIFAVSKRMIMTNAGLDS